MDAGFQALPQLFQWVIILSALATAFWVIVNKVIKPIAGAVRAIHHLVATVQDDHERIAMVEERSKELVNNSGSSLRDAVDRIEAAQTEMKEAFNSELLKVWQNLASRDAVEAVKKSAEMISADKG